jgi:hypothetical protein
MYGSPLRLRRQSHLPRFLARVREFSFLSVLACVHISLSKALDSTPSLKHWRAARQLKAKWPQAVQVKQTVDVALMNDDIGKIAEARVLAARAYLTIKQNLIFGVGVVHVLGITAAILRYIGPVEAAMLHLGPDVLVFLNSVRLLRAKLSCPP